jgi:hypothetical protein
VVWYFVKTTGTPLRGEYYRFKTEYLRPLPVPDASPEQRRMIETLVDYVLSLKREAGSLADPPSLMVTKPAWFEQLIDALVYELYFPEEFGSENRVSTALAAVDLPDIHDGHAPLESVTIIFNTLYAPEHPVRRAAYLIDTLPSVRIIEGKS